MWYNAHLTNQDKGEIIVGSYTIIKTSKETKVISFLMLNAVGTKTFGTNILNAWVTKDHRIASTMLNKCITKHNDTNQFVYNIDDIDESGEW